MTRFARAQGSKSSNERLPEEATSWHTMKHQLHEKQKSSQKRSRIEKNNYSVVKEATSTTKWAEFEEPIKSNSDHTVSKEFTKKKENLCKLSQNSAVIQKKSSKKKRLKKNKGIFKEIPIEDGEIKSLGAVVGSSFAADTKSKKKGKETNCIVNESGSGESQQQKKSFCDASSSPDNGSSSVLPNKKSWKEKRYDYYKKKREVKEKKQGPFNRRKPELTTKMFINGKEIDVVLFDRFPVKKEDAERLTELRNKLLAKGIPREEIAYTMKMERRKAEKALARERKKVCFHCRKSGHILSECPELGESNDTGTGICFKCGSTEHTHFECKVVRGQDFRYAECFICKEQGHIARQCPDNPRGLYPKGGGCKICGDVTHLKKDCPDLVEKKEGQTITLETLNNNSLELLEEDIKKVKNETPSEPSAKKKRKIVKF